MPDDITTLPAHTELAHDAPDRAPSRWSRLFGRARRQQDDTQHLAAARRAFCDTLADLPPPEATQLRCRLEASLSLGELWHLRPDVYRCLALHHTQAEAERRLGPLDAYFA